MNINSPKAQIRFLAEIIILVGSLLYILSALRESRFLGYKMFVENLVCNFHVFAIRHYMYICMYVILHKIYFLDDCAISCNVSLLLLYYDNNSMASFFMFY